MKELLYIEIPTPDTAAVRRWLQAFEPGIGQKAIAPEGFRLQIPIDSAIETNISDPTGKKLGEISAFVWSVQRTTYLKVFRWADSPLPGEREFLQSFVKQIRNKFPHHYPAPPAIDLSQQSIFEALAPYYPLTVKYFQQMPNGEYDLKRVYWWEQRWREGVQNPQQPRQVIFSHETRGQGRQGDKGDREAEGQRGRGAEENSATHHDAARSSIARDTRASACFPMRGKPALPPASPRTTHHSLSPTPPLSLSGTPLIPDFPTYDLIYIGGALGVVHAAVMAQLGYRVLLLERLPFGRMNREWNISRTELQSLIDLSLLTAAECESIIAREYKDGFNKFFDGNNPPHLKAPILHTPTVLNIALDAERLLQLCGDKLKAAGGEIWDETEFLRAEVERSQVVVQTQHLPSQTQKPVSGRVLVDAMGTASPIAWQLNGGRAFDSVCPTVGAVISGGFEPGVWDAQYGDVLNSHGDISRGRQLIWELFPGAGEEITVYLFHYHQVNRENPGSLLEMYEDFFTILPEYRRCDLDKLVWKKPTFGYIPGHFSVGSRDRTVAFDRSIAIGDAASLQSPLVFTGFGSLVRNLSRLTVLLDTALKHDLLSASDLDQIRAYQSNVAVTWMFSKGMMVPTGKFLPPARVNSMLNNFFGLLTDEPLEIADRFIKDRFDWLTFNRLALKAARKNPILLLWIWELAGAKDLLRWLLSYFNFSWNALLSFCFGGWLPNFLRQIQPWLEPRYPKLWLRLLAQSYALTTGMGRPQAIAPRPRTPVIGSQDAVSS